MDNPEVREGVIEYELASWKEFDGFIKQHHSNCPALIYRGQGDAEWKVESTLDRLEKRFPTTPNYSGGIPDRFDCPPASRHTHFRAFKQAARGKRGPNPPELSNNGWWALARHHGLAAPMSDWTLSPFVALFFAFEEEKCADPHGGWRQPEKRAVYAISSSCVTEKDADGDPAPRPFIPGGEVGDRPINQAAVFLRMPQKTDLETYVRKHFSDETGPGNSHARAILFKVIIVNEDRTGCLKHLNKMNINRMSLFPDLDGAASYINNLWEIDYDTSLGHIPDNLA